MINVRSKIGAKPHHNLGRTALRTSAAATGTRRNFRPGETSVDDHLPSSDRNKRAVQRLVHAAMEGQTPSAEDKEGKAPIDVQSAKVRKTHVLSRAEPLKRPTASGLGDSANSAKLQRTSALYSQLQQQVSAD